VPFPRLGLPRWKGPSAECQIAGQSALQRITGMRTGLQAATTHQCPSFRVFSVPLIDSVTCHWRGLRCRVKLSPLPDVAHHRPARHHLADLGIQSSSCLAMSLVNIKKPIKMSI
jgi:hypothetical protein